MEKRRQERVSRGQFVIHSVRILYSRIPVSWYLFAEFEARGDRENKKREEENARLKEEMEKEKKRIEEEREKEKERIKEEEERRLAERLKEKQVKKIDHNLNFNFLIVGCAWWQEETISGKAEKRCRSSRNT